MAFEMNSVNVPQSREINTSTGNVPYFLVEDEIFPLKTWLMRPYPGSNLSNEENKIYNYRHSRARRVIENTFGILSSRWRIFHKPIKATVENVEKYTLACLALHNYLRQTDNSMYTPHGFVDSENSNGEIKEGEWRSIKEKGTTAFRDLNPVRGSRYTNDAMKVRETLKDYVNSEVGSVLWQINYIRRTSHYYFEF